MTSLISKVAVTFPSLLAFEGLRCTTLAVAKKVVKAVEERIDLNRIVIISAIALSCLAVLASIYTSSFLALSLSLALCAASCLTYKINLELVEKTSECKRQMNYIVNEDRQKREHLEEHDRMMASISRLELQTRQQESLNLQLQQRLARALELVEFCDKVVGQAADFSKHTEEVTAEQRAGLKDIKEVTAEQRAGLKDIKSVAAELEGYKSVLGVWLGEMKKMLDHEEQEKSSQKVIRILEDFKEGQHTELARMLAQLQLVQDQFRSTQEQITASRDVITEQQATLRSISHDIQARTRELHDIHLKLAGLHRKLLVTKAHDSEEA
jgi:hypothetical protein